MKKFLFLAAAFLTFSIGAQASSKISGTTKMNLAGASTLAVGMGVASMRKLEEEANSHLSNFGGQDPDDLNDYDEYSGYTGVNDDFLDFGGENASLLSSVEGHNYTFTVVNAKSSALEFYLNPSQKNKNSDNTLVKGTLREGVFAAINDAGSDTSLTATGDSYGTLDFLRRFIENNPTYVKAFQIQSSTSAGVAQCLITIQEVSPFRQISARQLKPTMYQDQNMFNDKVINIPAGFDLNDQCEVKMKIAAATTLTVTIVCGAILNGAVALQNKRGKANRTRRRK